MCVIVITACGRAKETKPLLAWRLYKSPRIKYLKTKANNLGVDLYILSAKYGLIHSEEIIESYEAIMNSRTCKQLLPHILAKLEDINPSVVIYYKGGARREYFECIRKACELLNIRLLFFGYANMGDINKLDKFFKEGKFAVKTKTW